MTERHEPYVGDPAEPAPRPRLSGARPAVWTLLLVVLFVAAASLYLEGRGEEDPALQIPAEEAAS